MATTPAACASCVFGATSTSLLSFSAHAVETITVSVIPHLTLFANGGSTVNYESITQTGTDFVGSVSGVAKTFDREDEITWTVGDATLTYPTTYVQYLGFEGAAANTIDETCVNPTSTAEVELPTPMDSAPFIYPLEANATSTLLPAPLLEYLDQIPVVQLQFNTVPLTECAGLDYKYTPATTPSSETISYHLVSPSSQLAESTSPTPAADASSSSFPTYSGSASGNYTRTYGQPHPNLPQNTLQPSFQPSVNGSPTRATMTTAPSSSKLAYPNIPISSIATASPPAPGYTTVEHTTAFVIQPITGPTITTTQSGAQPISENGGKGPGDYQHITKDHSGEQGVPADVTSDGDSQPTPGPHDESPGGEDGGPHHHEDNGGEHRPGGAGEHHGSGVTPTVYRGDDTEVTAKPDGAVVYSGHTVRPGHSITFGSGPSRTVVALHTKGQSPHLVVGGSTYDAVPVTSMGRSPSHVASAVVHMNGHTITAVRSGKSVVIAEGDSTTTVPAGREVTCEGQTIRVPPHGSSVVVNGEHALLTAAGSSQAVITAGGHTFTAVDVGSSIVLKDGSSTITVKEGSQTEFEDQIVSVGPSGSGFLVVNGKTTSLSAAAAATTSSEAIITANGHTITAIDKSGSVVLDDASSTVTVKDGRKVTFEGQTISIPHNGSGFVVVNGETTSFSAVASTTISSSSTTADLGAYITGGLSGGDSPSETGSEDQPPENSTNGAASSAGLSVVTSFGVAVLGLLSALALL
ncbi:hypothetical protein LTR37_019615 [Vermiconidia calcicola]|uniref:Uncharacterized protein n=1 Tax=Vermiconidia calcicola TaxID=1690605 RepID=A0ACC3MDR9_9PEZI|nr:hypothetical protein LTR37_019615 [Vermiconidia calcicola]